MKKELKIKFYKLRKFYERYEKYLIPAALTFGFITDNFTFRVIGFSNLIYVFLGHLLFVGVNIGAINYFKENPPTGRIKHYWQFLAPLFVQFSFGNLFNGFLIYYFQSGSFFASWPFFLVLILLIIGNEVTRRYDITPILQISVYFFSIFAYLNLVFPHVLKSLGVSVFLGSGLLSLVSIIGFIYITSRFSKRIKIRKKKLWTAVALVFIFVNVLYFTNLIPPIPLALKDVGIYHNITKTNNHYEVIGEKCQNWDRCLFTKKKIHITKEKEPIYIFNAVHAPSEMNLEVVHEWKRYDSQKDEWITKAKLDYPMQGGREEGYRFYTYKQVTPGLWQVDIKTKRGQIIGRKSFQVIKSNKEPDFLKNKVD
ncbi:MAG: DUF2914 domain-containing protein [Candidatus Woesearchaeota archaeon]